MKVREMHPKERFLRAVEYRGVDRPPVGLFGTHTEYELGLAKHIGCDSVEAMYHTLGIDIWHCKNCPGLDFIGEQRYYQGKPADYWGIPLDTFQTAGYSGTGSPMSEVDSVDAVEAYRWPRVTDFTGENLAREIETHADHFALCGGINSPIFHNFTWICGFEDALIKLKLYPEVAKGIIRRITDFWVDYLKQVLEIGKGRIDLIENCNDFGTQRALFVSVDIFREFFRPALERLYSTAKNYGVKVMQHSCGSIGPLIPEFIDMGVDIINPIQVKADNMIIDDLTAKYKRQVAFYGGIDTQELLPQGPAAKIRAVTRHTVDLFGPDGGYILSGSQGLLDDIPYDHTLAMLDVVRESAAI